jgi:hypothetical protein
MTIDVQLERYELPIYWGPALINADMTGYSTLELRQIERFLEAMIEFHGTCWCIDVGDDLWFSAYHDAREFGVLPCDVATFTFDVTKRGE